MQKRIILDTNIILSFPEIFYILSDEYKIIVPDVVLSELNLIADKNQKHKEVNEFVLSLSKNNDIIIGTTNNLAKIFSDLSDVQGLSFVDFIIAEYAKNYQEKHRDIEVLLATNDRRLIDYSKSMQIKAITMQDLMELISSNKKDKVIGRKIKNITSKRKFELFINAIIAIITGIIANIVSTNYEVLIKVIQVIYKYINVWGTILTILFFGFLLFWIRSKFRLSYGVVEFVLGVISSIFVFVPEFHIAKLTLPNALQFFGGLYIIVRGLDNFGKGLKISRNYQLWEKWNKIFPE